MRRNNSVLIVLLIVLTGIFVLLNGQVIAVGDFIQQIDSFENLRLENEYVVMVVNQDENGQGRFAIETTGGAPFRSNDDDKPLVYGRPKPWTSYSTIWVNGDYYVFGGNTGRRAGKTGQYGTVTDPPRVMNGSIHTTTQLADIINVEQILTIIKSSTTGLYDSVQIKYRIENLSNEEQKVGLRIMLDTMLGQNDGAPFRIGKDAVTADRVYYKKQLPQFWQAFDSISNPNVTSQGTFTGSDVTSPDKVNLADWGSLADGVWDFEFNPGEEFLRKGEFEIDSAIAMYWIPEVLRAGESRTYITNYGLGGITIVPGLLSLGVTSPAEVTFDTPEKTFPIVAYVENTSEIKAKNVRIKLNLSDVLLVDDREKSLGDLEPGDIAQVVWEVRSAGRQLPSSTDYQVKVEADNTDSNQVKREIKFVAPPRLEAGITLPEPVEVRLGELDPNPFPVETVIENTGGSTLYDVSAELILPPNLILAPLEKTRKYLGDLEAGKQLRKRWMIRALQVEGELPFALDVRGLHDHNVTEIENVKIPGLEPLVYLTPAAGEGATGTDENYLIVDIGCANLQEVDELIMNLDYDPEQLKPVFISRGDVFYRDSQALPWTRPDLSESGKIKFEEILPTEVDRGILASVYFKVLQEGKDPLNWGEASFLDKNGESQQVSLESYLSDSIQ